MSAESDFLKKYEIIRELGQGGMAKVFLARDRRLDRLIALKTIKAPIEDPAVGTHGHQLFERIRRMREDFLELTNRLGQSYVGIEPDVAEREITEAVAHARKVTRTSRTRKRR